MKHVSVLPEHVDLLDTGNGLHVEFLQRALQFLVILSGGGLAFPDHLSSYGSLSA